MVAALVASMLLAGSQANLRIQGDLTVRPVTLTPQMRLDAVRRAAKGLGNVTSVGAVRTRTWLEKGTSDLRIGANTPQAYANGVSRFGKSSSFWTEFRAKPAKLYAVAIFGRFDCTSVLWRQDTTTDAVPGPATLPIGNGETVAVLALKAAEPQVVVFVSQPKGGKGEFLVERVEITELN